MKNYFYLQLIMINRKFRKAGINPVPGYFLGLLIFCLFSEFIFSKTIFANYIFILICLYFELKLSEKNRNDFLLSTFGNNKKNKIRIIENLLLCLPFAIVLAYKQAYSEALILLIFSTLIATLSFKLNLHITIPTPFSRNQFEFSVGFRKSFFIILTGYTLTVIAITADNLNLGIFSMMLIFLTVPSYYTKPEQEYYVWMHAKKPQAFLKNKIRIASRYGSLLAVPQFLCLIFWYTEDYKPITLFFLIGIFFLWMIILAKYAAYPEEINIPEGIIIAMCIFFPPLLLAVIPFFYQKAINKLKILLHD